MFGVKIIYVLPLGTIVCIVVLIAFVSTVLAILTVPTFDAIVVLELANTITETTIGFPVEFVYDVLMALEAVTLDHNCVPPRAFTPEKI